MTMHTCPECGHHFHDDAELDQSARELVAEWEERCARRGHLMPQGRISESVAAELIGQNKLWLANKRQNGKGPPVIDLPANRGHFSYSMRALAEWWLRLNMFDHR